MATNPMQRKARNSFLLGMLLMLLLCGAVIAFLVLQLTNMKKAEKELEESYVKVYTLNKDVQSGKEITASDLTEAEVEKTKAPTDYLTPSGLGDKNIAKISMTKGTVVSKEMIYVDETKTGNDVRKQEFNMFILPSDLENGDYIDVRLLLPSGNDYIVVSKKKVEIPNVAGVDSTDTISIELSEDEINMISNAIVDAFKIDGAKLYVNKYTEPGIQEVATPTYAVSSEVMELINSNPNIVKEARNELWNRYNNNNQASQRNNIITPAVTNDDADKNLQTNMEESITNSINTRKQYLEGLSSSSTTTSSSSSNSSSSSSSSSSSK